MRRLCLKTTICQEQNVEPDSANITVPDPHLTTQVCCKLLEVTGEFVLGVSFAIYLKVQ